MGSSGTWRAVFFKRARQQHRQQRRIASTFLCWLWFGWPKIEIHSADIDDPKVPGKIFFTQKSCARFLGYERDDDFGIGDSQTAKCQFLDTANVDWNDALSRVANAKF